MRQLNKHLSLIISGLIILTVFTGIGCKKSSTHKTSFSDEKTGIAFEFPTGWSELEDKEWRERKMGENKTLITIMDEEREAGFAVIPVHLNAQMKQTLTEYGDEFEDQTAVFIESIHAAGPNNYRGYKLLEKGETYFAGENMGEIVFQGKKPNKKMRWQRIVIAVSEQETDELLMFVFSTPLGEESDYEDDFQYIEDTWQWL